MYSFEWLRPAWERLWSAVHERAPWTPVTLRWDGDVHDHWADPDCRVAQACGWPVATTLRTHVRVVGAFTLALDDADGHRYRSVILARRPGALTDFVSSGATVAANGPDSLSGWVSLRAATRELDDGWPIAVTWTGGHVESLRALQAGRSDIASVDELTLAHVRRHDPGLVDDLFEVGRGPWVPSLPVVVPADTSDARVGDLRRAFMATLADPALQPDRVELLLDGFVGLDEAAFDAVLALGAAG